MHCMFTKFDAELIAQAVFPLERRNTHAHKHKVTDATDHSIYPAQLGHAGVVNDDFLVSRIRRPVLDQSLIYISVHTENINFGPYRVLDGTEVKLETEVVQNRPSRPNPTLVSLDGDSLSTRNALEYNAFMLCS